MQGMLAKQLAVNFGYTPCIAQYQSQTVASPMRVWSRCWAPPKTKALMVSFTGVSTSLGPWIARLAKHLLSVVWPASGLLPPL
jgi:hypothetical protein